MLARRNHIADHLERVATRYEHLSHENRVCPRAGVIEHVLSGLHSRFGNPDHRIGKHGDDVVKDARIDLKGLEVSCVDTDHASPGVERTPGIVAVVYLDEGRHAQRVHTLNQRCQDRV